MFYCALFTGVEDEMALAIEISRREAESHHLPEKPRLQNRTSTEPDSFHSSPFSAATRRSHSAAPYYSYGGLGGGVEDDEDEELQMALACSLSEMEAQQRAAATGVTSGAGRGGRAVGDRRGGGVTKTKKIVMASVAEEKEKENQTNMSSAGQSERKGKEKEAGMSPESATAQCSEEQLQPATTNSDGGVKKRKKCGCVVS